MYEIGDRVHVSPTGGDDFDEEFDGTIVDIDFDQSDEGCGPDYIVERDNDGGEYNLLSDNLEPLQ